MIKGKKICLEDITLEQYKVLTGEDSLPPKKSMPYRVLRDYGLMEYLKYKQREENKDYEGDIDPPFGFD